MTSTGKFVCMTHHFIFLWINPFTLSLDSEGWWFEHSMSWLPVGSSAEGAKDVSLFRLSPPRGWGSLIMTSTGKFVCMTHPFILLWINPCSLSLDSEGGWFEHSMS